MGAKFPLLNDNELRFTNYDYFISCIKILYDIQHTTDDVLLKRLYGEKCKGDSRIAPNRARY